MTELTQIRRRRPGIERRDANQPKVSPLKLRGVPLSLLHGNLGRPSTLARALRGDAGRTRTKRGEQRPPVEAFIRDNREHWLHPTKGWRSRRLSAA